MVQREFAIYQQLLYFIDANRGEVLSNADAFTFYKQDLSNGKRYRQMRFDEERRADGFFQPGDCL